MRPQCTILVTLVRVGRTGVRFGVCTVAKAGTRFFLVIVGTDFARRTDDTGVANLGIRVIAFRHQTGGAVFLVQGIDTGACAVPATLFPLAVGNRTA